VRPRIDFRFDDGTIEIASVVSQVAWERLGRVRYPVLRHTGTTTKEIGDVLDSCRDEQFQVG